ncbi:MAG: phosphoglycerate mutase (2,3-diphosphoglycerate-independent) [Candidatus Yanofskybacteria bacterium CG10_big_fil_rev_8_21_14_0_10_36_16]|uniref:2,3-bisphosphoglycerate-independent phosphoglycerate mutase n=1 Tax=Candidatus Yanofskybacteria bacterium CG10_big_fil_rev_8_21_14_0_10_36_16 TaxID=1975096 RepID=A0A2J0Q7F6_9BACT|nr:MAG: phosphoglycerate mutase (2,3-diphosphoglycerate-independent) [Candidatus Yanofskybacteria bacterium CG10_big_fil_rev_8_21_14_0_10_36_16]
MSNTSKPFVLTILDGWGHNEKKIDNAIAQANTPTMDMFEKAYPSGLLQASGLAVGMPWGESGNSEVGHLTIGSGRIIEQYSSKINKSIANGEFFIIENLVGAFRHAREHNGSVHIVGLLTSGTVHASYNNLLALIEMAAKINFEKTYIHLFLDGKDSGLKEGVPLMKQLRADIERLQHGILTTVIGRDFGMDKNNDWNKTQKAYNLLVSAMGQPVDDLVSKTEEFYSVGMTDPEILPLLSSQSHFHGIKDNDSIIFFNFREDGMRQIVKPFIDNGFSDFETKKLKNIYIASMTRYFDGTPIHVIFERPNIKNSLSEILSSNSKTHFHIAETVKYAHVTYFFKGLSDKEFEGETNEFLKSPNILLNNPAMRSQEITTRVVDEIIKGYYDFIVLNFANADMLAHTGNFEATKRGIEWIDKGLKEIHDAVLAKNATMIVTADHGNAEEMIEKGTGDPVSKHAMNPVPVHLVGKNYKKQGGNNSMEIIGLLSDVAPTILELMQLPKPPEMTGRSLIQDLE